MPRNRQENSADPSKDDAIEAGLGLLEGFRPEDRVHAAYGDLCLRLDPLQVKQVNELVGLILAARGGR